MRASHLRRIFEFERAALQDRRKLFAAFQQKRRRLLQHERLRRIDDVVRSEPVVQPSRSVGLSRGSHLFGDRRGERDHVMLHFTLDFMDTIHVERSVLAKSDRGVFGHVADFSERFRRCQFDLKPLRKTIFVGENFAHFRARVSGDQENRIQESGDRRQESVDDRFGRLLRIGDDQPSKKTAAVERFFGALLHDRGMIVVLA